MTLNRGLLFWGLALITAGAVALAAQQGYLDKDALRDLWRLWPVILIVIGVSVVVSRTPFAVVGTVAAALVVGGAGGALIAVGPTLSLNCGTGDPTSLTSRSGDFGSSAGVELDFNCGTLSVAMTDNSAWTVASGQRGGDPARITASSDRLEVRSPDNGRWWDGGRQRWEVSLPTDSVYTLNASPNAADTTIDLGGGRFSRVSLNPNAGSLTLDLTDADVERLELSLNAGSASVTIGTAMNMRGSLSVNAGSIQVCTLGGVAVEYTLDSNVAFSHNLDGSGLVRVGDTWSTSGYAWAAQQIRLEISGNAGSFTLNPEGGCG
ncbi:MAG: DUF5668 domain-containing protein [Chloroflexota bacterium]|nr:DUF5668 domain-containing protein [Chloroflexota bacterium]